MSLHNVFLVSYDWGVELDLIITTGLSPHCHWSMICANYSLLTWKLFSRILVSSSNILSTEKCRLSERMTIPTRNLRVWPSLGRCWARPKLNRAVYIISKRSLLKKMSFPFEELPWGLILFYYLLCLSSFAWSWARYISTNWWSMISDLLGHILITSINIFVASLPESISSRIKRSLGAYLPSKDSLSECLSPPTYEYSYALNSSNLN